MGNQILVIAFYYAPTPSPPPTPTPQSNPTPYIPVKPGDVNGDSFVDIVDALLIAQFYVGLQPEPFNSDVADVNCDGMIDIIDALLIAQYYVGLITLDSCV